MCLLPACHMAFVSHDSTVMEDGWPLGLQPLNARVSLASSDHDHSGSVSFNTMLAASPSSSSDSGTESKGSCVHDNGITFGSLIGVSNILELSKRSVRRKNAEAMKENRINNDNKRSKVWVFSLCLRENVDVESDIAVDVPSSLGHFLAVERRAASEYRKNHNPHRVQNL
ncbi:hypothetical protein V6N12_051423 [Hibiscus sabdariffa]|uniref:Uncharacterized protein n=1 Tax=Hibiscus sabdariffa TaxID=183260 RepID=A0ABR2GH50_9ROSI